MGSNQEPRINPIIASEPEKNRQDSSDCLKTSCFPFTNAFKEEERDESMMEGRYKFSFSSFFMNEYS